MSDEFYEGMVFALGVVVGLFAIFGVIFGGLVVVDHAADAYDEACDGYDIHVGGMPNNPVVHVEEEETIWICPNDDSDGTDDVTVVDCGEYEVYAMGTGEGAPDAGTELCSDERTPVTGEDEDRVKERVGEKDPRVDAASSN